MKKIKNVDWFDFSWISECQLIILVYMEVNILLLFIIIAIKGKKQLKES